MSQTIVRLQGLELRNIKNVEFGKIEMPNSVCDLSKCPWYDSTCVQALIIPMSIQAFDFLGLLAPEIFLLNNQL